MATQPEDDSLTQTDLNDLLDRTLERHHTWNWAPALLEMWASCGSYYRDRGVLKELLLRGPGVGEAGAIAVTAGYRPYKNEDQRPLSQAPGDERGGFLHIIPPIKVEQTSWVTAMIANMAPWLGPSFMGMRAFVDGDPSDRYVIAVYEHPSEVFVIPQIGDRQAFDRRGLKRFKERLHLDRYCTDHLVALGSSPYDSISEGADPPDFVCKTADKVRSVECVQFAVERRRRLHGHFGAVRTAVLRAARESRERFARLHGCIVYMWFDDPTSPDGLPPHVTDTVAVDEIVDALAGYDADPRRLWVASGAELPDRPDLAPVTTPHGCTLYAVPMLQASPITSFFVAAGFELGFGVRTIHRASEAWGDLVRAIERKDRHGTDDLLVSVSGPNDYGFAFPSEDLVASVALEGGLEPPHTQYLKRVRLHFWNSGRIVEVVPTISEVVRPMFSGSVRAHLSAAGVGEDIAVADRDQASS